MRCAVQDNERNCRQGAAAELHQLPRSNLLTRPTAKYYCTSNKNVKRREEENCPLALLFTPNSLQLLHCVHNAIFCAQRCCCYMFLLIFLYLPVCLNSVLPALRSGQISCPEKSGGKIRGQAHTSIARGDTAGVVRPISPHCSSDPICLDNFTPKLAKN